MRKSDYKREKKKLDDLVVKLEHDLLEAKRKRDALDLVWTQIFHHSDGDGNGYCEENQIHQQPEAEGNSILDTSAGTIIKANGHTGQWVEDEVNNCESTFKVIDIVAMIKRSHPGVEVNHSTVAGKLSKMAKENRLEVVQAGKGRSPGIFRKVAV